MIKGNNKINGALQVKGLLHKYKHAWLLLYVFIYIPWFVALEARDSVQFTFLESKLDHLIPFCEYFIIAYVLWFFYVAFTVMVLFFKSRNEFYQICAFLFTGMTISLIIYTLWPNAQALRPEVFPRDNFFTRVVQTLYSGDTSTNVCPSLHVFNSIGCHIALQRSQVFRHKKALTIASFMLMTAICLSTVFLKQHSVIDGFYAIIMAGLFYELVYRRNILTQMKRCRNSKRN